MAGGGEQDREQAPDRPKLRLLTRPAWLAADSAGSVKLVAYEYLPVGQRGVGWVLS